MNNSTNDQRENSGAARFFHKIGVPVAILCAIAAMVLALSSVVHADACSSSEQADSPSSFVRAEECSSSGLDDSPLSMHWHQGHHHSDGNDMQALFFHDSEMTPKFLYGIDLTEAQQDKIFELQHAQTPAFRQKHKELLSMMKELHAIESAEKLDEKQAKKLTTSIGNTIAETALMRVETNMKIRSVLTDQQRKELAGKHQR